MHFVAHPAALSDAGELLLDVLRRAAFAPGAGNCKYQLLVELYYFYIFLHSFTHMFSTITCNYTLINVKW